MANKTLLWVIIGILFLVAIFLVFKAGSSGNSDKIDMTGWTENEIMNYEMHGTLPAKVQQSKVQPSSGGMVGGC